MRNGRKAELLAQLDCSVVCQVYGLRQICWQTRFSTHI